MAEPDMIYDKNSLVALAKRGVLKRFASCLSDQDHPQHILFAALRMALLWNQSEKAALLLESGADPLICNEENDQLLTHAAIGGNPELVRLMIGKGCDPNHRNVNGRTALHFAARSGRLDAVRLLIEYGAQIDCTDDHGQTPLTEALANRYYSTAMELIQHGAEVNVRSHPMNCTPLMMAASGDSPELLRLLLQKGVPLEDKDDNGCTPLMYAVRAGRLEIAELLLNAGADMGATDNQCRDIYQWSSSLKPDVARLILNRRIWTPKQATQALLKAASNSDIEALSILLEKGALIQPEEEGGESALAKVVLSGAVEGLKCLLANPMVKVDYRSGKRFRTALCLAAFTEKDSQEKVRLLIASGADPAIADADGMTPVHHAAAHSKLELVDLLDRSGGDIFSCDGRQRTILHLATYEGSGLADARAKLDTVTWLLDKGLPPDSADNNGLTPLMLAAIHAADDVAQLLIHAGASLNAVDEQGHTALYHAICYGTDYGYNDRYLKPKTKKSDPAATIVEILLAASADPNIGNILSPARAWRWPGAVRLLERYGAKE